VEINVDVAVGVLMVIGLVGTVLPFVPGLPLIVAAALVWLLAGRTDPGQWFVFAIVAAVAVGASIASSVIPARRASKAGASGWVLALGAVGLLIGAIVIPVVGALVGWPLGIFVGEWLRTGDGSIAWKTTRETIVGLGISTAIQLVAAVICVGVWGVAAVTS
jgi:uncharacterized protein YqgC (DUF456 family)